MYCLRGIFPFVTLAPSHPNILFALQTCSFDHDLQELTLQPDLGLFQHVTDKYTLPA